MLQNILNLFRGLFGFAADKGVSFEVSVPIGQAPPQQAPIVNTLTPPPSVIAAGFSKSMSDCHKLIQQAYPLVEFEFCHSHPNMSLKCDYTYRSPQLQLELFKKGRSLVDGQWVVTDKSQVVTQQDGTKVRSHHNVYPSQAADVYIVRDGQIVWSDPALYTELGNLWNKHGLISGATWKYADFHDWDHVQVAYNFV